MTTECSHPYTSNPMPFLVESLSFDEQPHDEDAVREFWASLGVEPDMLEVLREVNPIWRDGHLFVSASMRADGELIHLH